MGDLLYPNRRRKASDLARLLRLEVHSVAAHLRILQELGVVETRSQGGPATVNTYRLVDKAATREVLWRFEVRAPASSQKLRRANVRRRAVAEVDVVLDRLRTRRVERGWSQPDLGRRLGWSSEQVGRIERQETPVRLVDILAMAHELDYATAHLFM